MSTEERNRTTTNEAEKENHFGCQKKSKEKVHRIVYVDYKSSV